MKIWFLGMSIYPISYIISFFIKFYEGKGNMFDLQSSLPVWSIMLLIDNLLHRLFNADLVRLDGLFSFITFSIIVLLLILLNSLLFLAIISILPKNIKSASMIVLFLLLLLINTYNININF